MSAEAEVERVRLFVALELPDSAREDLGRWRASAVPDLPGLRPVRREALHVTLCFLGWREASEIRAIGAACEAAARGQEIVQLSFGAALWLPRRRPRVLAVAVEDEDEALARLQGSLSEALSDGGWFEPESRPFLGHVTVARLSRGARIRTAPLPTVSVSPFAAVEVTLFRSRLQRTGARYDGLRTIELCG